MSDDPPDSTRQRMRDTVTWQLAELDQMRAAEADPANAVPHLVAWAEIEGNPDNDDDPTIPRWDR